VSNTVQQTQTQ